MASPTYVVVLHCIVASAGLGSGKLNLLECSHADCWLLRQNNKQTRWLRLRHARTLQWLMNWAVSTPILTRILCLSCLRCDWTLAHGELNYTLNYILTTVRPGGWRPLTDTWHLRSSRVSLSASDDDAMHGWWIDSVLTTITCQVSHICGCMDSAYCTLQWCGRLVLWVKSRTTSVNSGTGTLMSDFHAHWSPSRTVDVSFYITVDALTTNSAATPFFPSSVSEMSIVSVHNISPARSPRHILESLQFTVLLNCLSRLTP